jgi:hypothetical protein
MSNGVAGMPSLPWFDGNAYWSNGAGNRDFMDDGSYNSNPITLTNQINCINPYTNVLDQYLSTDPFNNDAGGDFTINPTIITFGTVGLLGGYSKAGYQYPGALQPTAAACEEGFVYLGQQAWW